MPTYCFRDSKGNPVERFMSVREFERRVVDDRMKEGGRTLVLDVEAQHSGMQPKSCASWPMQSLAAGVHPNQVREASEEAARRGVPTDFARNGDAIFRSADHRRKFLRAHGMIDRSSYC